MPRPPLSADTTSEAEARQVAAWRRMGAAERLRAAQALSVTVRRLELAGLVRQHPALTPAACARLLARRHLGEPLASLVYGDDG